MLLTEQLSLLTLVKSVLESVPLSLLCALPKATVHFLFK